MMADKANRKLIDEFTTEELLSEVAERSTSHILIVENDDEEESSIRYIAIDGDDPVRIMGLASLFVGEWVEEMRSN